jgi:hypothetical protein
LFLIDERSEKCRVVIHRTFRSEFHQAPIFEEAIMTTEIQRGQRLKSLERHLKKETPVLLEVVKIFKELDRFAKRTGYLGKDESFAFRVPWWPLISILGVYSSGKSTFVNHFLDYQLQATGNQAVDDRFTVICYTDEKSVRVLPGLALDGDPRFPLYRISEAIEDVAPGEGSRVDAYLQLKACPSQKLRGKILIDSPGFDADAQRTSTLRITDNIIDLSDLVLVFFDARHPEAGSMQNTLNHLVKGTIFRKDSNKFMYILNQIDATAHDDNPEDVVAAWHRSLAQYGLTAGKTYTIFSPSHPFPAEHEVLRERFERKRDSDLAAIHARIEQVGVERAYRIVGMLEQTARMLRDDVVLKISRFIARWRRLVLFIEGTAAGILLIILAFMTFQGASGWFRSVFPSIGAIFERPEVSLPLAGAFIIAAGYIHFRLRGWAARRVSQKMLAEISEPVLRNRYQGAFKTNSRWWRSLFNRRPAGWNKKAVNRLAEVEDDAKRLIQILNDAYTNPSGQPEEGLTPEPDSRQTGF